MISRISSISKKESTNTNIIKYIRFLLTLKGYDIMDNAKLYPSLTDKQPRKHMLLHKDHNIVLWIKVGTLTPELQYYIYDNNRFTNSFFYRP